MIQFVKFQFYAIRFINGNYEILEFKFLTG